MAPRALRLLVLTAFALTTSSRVINLAARAGRSVLAWQSQGPVDWDDLASESVLTLLAVLMQPMIRLTAELVGPVHVPGVLAHEELRPGPFLGLATLSFNISDLNVTGLESLRSLRIIPTGGPKMNTTSAVDRLSAALTIDAELRGAGVPVRARLAVSAQMSNVSVELAWWCAMTREALREGLAAPTALFDGMLRPDGGDLRLEDAALLLGGPLVRTVSPPGNRCCSMDRFARA